MWPAPPLAATPAGDLESIVHRAIDALLDDPLRLVAKFGSADGHRTIAARHDDVIANLWRPSALAFLLETLETRIIISENAVRIAIGRQALARLFAIVLPAWGMADPTQIEVPTILRRRGHELRLFEANSDVRPADRDDKPNELHGKGWAAWEQRANGPKIDDATKRGHACLLARLRFSRPTS